MATGLMVLPALATVSQCFDKKRPAALSIAVFGSSLGGIISPIILSKILNSSSFEFERSMRIISFVMLLFTYAAIDARLPPRPTTFFIGAAFKQAEFVFLVAASFLMYIGMWAPLFYIPTYAV